MISRAQAFLFGRPAEDVENPPGRRKRSQRSSQRLSQISIATKVSNVESLMAMEFNATEEPLEHGARSEEPPVEPGNDTGQKPSSDKVVLIGSAGPSATDSPGPKLSSATRPGGRFPASIACAEIA